MHRHALRHLAIVLAATPLTAAAADFWWQGFVPFLSPNTIVGLTSTNFDSPPGTPRASQFSTDAAGLNLSSVLPGASDRIRYTGATIETNEASIDVNYSVGSILVEASADFVGLYDEFALGTTLTLGSAGIVVNNLDGMLVRNLKVAAPTALSINVSQAATVVDFQADIFTPTLVKSGAGRLALASQGSGFGPSGNTFGTLTINDGTVEVISENALPASANVNLIGGNLIVDNIPSTLNNIVVGNGTNGTGRTISPGFVLPLPGGIEATLTINGNISYNGPGSPAIVSSTLILPAGQHLINNPNDGLSNTFYDITLDGKISGAGGYTKSGRTYLVLNDVATHTGPTIVDGGRLYAAANGALSSASALTVNSPGQLLLNPTVASAHVTVGNYSQTVASLAGSGSIVLGSASLTVATTTTTNFSGVISGTGGLIKNGPGTLILWGNNTYSAPTIIGNGVLQIGNGGTFGSVAGDITNDSSLIFNRSDTFTYGGIISSTGSLTKAGPGTLVLTGSHTYGNGTTIADGTLQIGNGSTTGSIPGNVINNANITFNRSNSLAFSGVISGNGTLTKIGNGALFLTGNNTYTGTTTVTAGTLRIGNGGFTGTVAGNITNNSGLVVDRATALTLPGRISGTGTLTKVGAGVLTLSADQALPHVQSGLTISGGSIDLTNNDFVVDYTGSSSIATLISYVISGQLTADDDFGGLPTTLGISEAVDLGLVEFAGVAVDGTTVIVKYTYVGDANLDGQVDALDYERIDLAIGNTGVLGTAQGDLNYDGNVDALDYEQVDLNIGNGVGSPLGAVFVPEPAGAVLAVFGAGVLARRRAR